MAAQDYYQSFSPHRPQGTPTSYPAPPPAAGGRRPSLAPMQSPYNYSPQPSSFAPQQFLQLPGQALQPSPQPWNPQQGQSYPPPVPYTGGETPQSYALMPSRSKSEPPENRRMSVESYASHHHHHHHSHNRHHSRSRSRSRSGSGDSRSRSRSSRHHSHHRKSSHSDRDTFLGAGAGGLIGDALLPGLGTLFGAFAGGYGGHEHAHKKDSRSKSDSGYRDGITVKSGWIRR